MIDNESCEHATIIEVSPAVLHCLIGTLNCYAHKVVIMFLGFFFFGLRLLVLIGMDYSLKLSKYLQT